MKAKPKPLISCLSINFIGKLKGLIDKNTEVCFEAVIFQFLAVFGVLIGKSPFLRVGADCHRAVLFVTIVGASAKARKGSSWGIVKALIQPIYPEWFEDWVLSGLSSSEGLINEVRDTGVEGEPEPEKRVLVQESEFASILKNFHRKENKLSDTIRKTFDSEPLRVVTRSNPLKSTNAHIGIAGHITQQELGVHLNSVEIANGLGNRFMYVFVERTRLIPFPQEIDESFLKNLAKELKEIVSKAEIVKKMTMTEDARTKWTDVYPDLSRDYPGLLGQITARAEVQVLRLAMILSLLERKEEIDLAHLEAALDLWRYSFESCQFIFDSKTGDKLADKLWTYFSQNQKATRSEIQKFLSNNGKKEDIDRALYLLESFKIIAKNDEYSPSNRHIEVWKSLISPPAQN